jgi:hypothetical protein
MHTDVEELKNETHKHLLVTILVNTTRVAMERGIHPVKEIKEAAHCPLAFELERIEHGHLVPLADDASVDVEEGERFVCHPRDGASS